MIAVMLRFAYCQRVFYTVYVKLANRNHSNMKMRELKNTIFLKTLPLQVVVGSFFAMGSRAYADTGIQPEGLPRTEASSHTVGHIFAIVFGVIGAFAVLNVVLSGFKYITSAGEPQKTSEAKNGIVYSLVGLMLAISAEAIVAFIVNKAS